MNFHWAHEKYFAICLRTLSISLMHRSEWWAGIIGCFHTMNQPTHLRWNLWEFSLLSLKWEREWTWLQNGFGFCKQQHETEIEKPFLAICLTTDTIYIYMHIYGWTSHHNGHCSDLIIFMLKCPIHLSSLDLISCWIRFDAHMCKYHWTTLSHRLLCATILNFESMA